MKYEFHVDTVPNQDEALLAMVGCQEAGFELVESAGLNDGRVMLFFRRPFVAGTPPLNGHARKPVEVAKGAKKR